MYIIMNVISTSLFLGLLTSPEKFLRLRLALKLQN